MLTDTSIFNFLTLLLFLIIEMNYRSFALNMKYAKEKKSIKKKKKQVRMIFYPQQKILKNKPTLPPLPTTGIFKHL